MSVNTTFCPYCDRRFEEDEKSNARCTRDHVIPRIMGGNIVVHACWQCNNDKGAYLPKEWLLKLRAAGDPRVRHVERFLAETDLPVEPFKLERDPAVNAICERVAGALYAGELNAHLTAKQWDKALRISMEIISDLRSDGFMAANPQNERA